MALSWVVLDFETVSSLDVTVVGSWRYAEDPTTELLCVGYSFMGKHPVIWETGDLVFLELVEDPEVTFIAFNAQFEKAIWRHIMVAQYGFPDIPNARWHDVQAVAAMKQMPQALDKLGAALKLQHQKGNFRVQDLSKPNKKTGSLQISADKQAECIEYNKLDIRTETEAHEKLGWMPPGERKVWLLNQRVNERGVFLDLPYIHACQNVVADASASLAVRFRELTGLRPSQLVKFKIWLHSQGVKLDSLAKDTLKEAMSEDEAVEGTLYTGGLDLPGPCREALEIYQAVGSTSIAKLGRMLACVSADGRSRGLLQYHGTGPGRSAGRLWQPHNLPKPTLKCPMEALVPAILTEDPEYVEMVAGGPAIRAVADGLRHCIIAAPGRVLMSNDYAGIQARLTLATAGQHDKVQMMKDGLDVHADMATMIFHRPIGKHDKERDTGKNAVFGCCFQIGGATFQQKFARKETLEFCNNVVQVYRKEWAPKVPYLWYGLEDAAARTVHTGRPHEAYGILYAIDGEWLTARLPSGRRMWYYRPEPTRSQAPWDPGQLKDSFTYQAPGLSGALTTCYAFGGQLTENVIMGMERDIMTHAMLLCEANGLPVVLEVHDEIVVEPLEKDADHKAFSQILLDTEPWVKQIQVPVAVEGWTGDRYHKG
jgi:DNA polymerase bacteriophage-type